MKNLTPLVFLMLISGFLTSCFEDNDDNAILSSEINDFVWKGMNVWYLYKDNIPDLANDRFSSNEEYGTYLNSFSTPEALFENLIYQRQTVDKFSWIVDDYIALEQLLNNGVSTSNGMEFALFFHPNSGTDVFGVVTHVLPNTSAESQGVIRGDIFDAIDGTMLTSSNLNSLLNADSYTVNLAAYDNNGTPETSDDSIVSTNESISLTKVPYTENPIFKTDIFQVNGENVGYLMYNGFTPNFDAALNAVFGDFLSNNVQHLVLDLRYNPGGSVNSTILLAGMITGQFTGEVFSTEEWNSEFQEAFENENPEALVNRFKDNDDGALLNSLNLKKVYVLATQYSASASELLINSLDPYINVVHIGDFTEGKYQASTTIYDSPNFGRQDANPSHTYAMQPLIFKSLNSVGNTDYDNGLMPDLEVSENFTNLAPLGDINEPLLAAALSDIENATGRSSFTKIQQPLQLKSIKIFDSQYKRFKNEMFIEKEIPNNLMKELELKQQW